MKKALFFENAPVIRRAESYEASALCQLIYAAYKDLAKAELNFTGSYQDQLQTRQRMATGDVYVLEQDEQLLGTVTLAVVPVTDGRGDCLYINQLAVRPNQRGKGFGSLLLDLAERRARGLGLHRLRLDTAVSATHLVNLYRGRGFEAIDVVQWEGKTFPSYIMEKWLTDDTPKGTSWNKCSGQASSLESRVAFRHDFQPALNHSI